MIIWSSALGYEAAFSSATPSAGSTPFGAECTDRIEFCTDIFNYYADNGPGLIADKPLPGHDTARVEYRPVGPVLGVMPWNYPYYQVTRFAAPNLIVGNTVILKHAENCPTSALAIAQIMTDAGVPDGVYVNLFATHEQVAAMIADPRLHGVSLTGSERAGPSSPRRPAAAWLHDIGYAPDLTDTDLHQLDGARYLRDAQHADAMLCRLVAHHS